MTPDWLIVRENDSGLNVTTECNCEFPHVSLLDSMEELLIAWGAFRKQDTCHDLEGDENRLQHLSKNFLKLVISLISVHDYTTTFVKKCYD